MIDRRTLLAGTAGIVSTFAFGSIVTMTDQDSGLVSLSGPTMGTYFRILVPKGHASSENLKCDVHSSLADVDRLMSTYRGDSEVSELNNAESNVPVQISMQTTAVIEEALNTGKLTQGAFDVTVGPLVDLWGFGASGRTAAVPDTGQIAQTTRRVGIDGLKTKQGTAWKTRPDLEIDLSGIAKGYAVDQIAARLTALGCPSYLIDVGGELRAKGKRPDGQQWRVGIERPSQNQRSVHRIVTLQDMAIATSGDYRDYFVENGQSFAHVIDPRTSRPAKHALASVTVLERDAMTADALSTALMVMGPDEGMRFADQLGLAAYFVSRDGDRLTDQHTRAFAPWIDQKA